MHADYHELYAAARAGSHAAQDDLVRRYWRELGRFVEKQAGASVRRLEEPEDVLMKAFETFLRRMPGFPPDLSEERLKAHLFQIAKWELGNVYRRRTREQREASVRLPEPQESLASRGPVTQRDDLRKLQHVLERMNPKFASVLALKLEGKSVQRTAEELGLTEENVRKRLTRAKDELDALTREWQREERR